MRGTVGMMKKLVQLAWIAVVLGSTVGAPAGGTEIVAVLERSQAMRLESFAQAEAQGPRALIVRGSFDRLVQSAGSNAPVELRVVTGAVSAECLLGRVVVANESLADLDEPVRMFLLAHELGHVALGHWQRLTQLYARYVPGAVAPRNTDAVADALLSEASHLSVQHELQADAFALDLLRSLGYPLEDMLGAFFVNGMQRDTSTHPGTGKRVAHLRSLAERGPGAPAPG
jgi:Zn-dependent protease with chaperone function